MKLSGIRVTTQSMSIGESRSSTKWEKNEMWPRDLK